MRIETVVIIINYNGIEHLAECFESLENQSYKNFKIILIDNASTDNSVSFVENNFPDTDILLNTKNYGFPEPVNSAIRHAIKDYSPKYLTFLNNDTKVDKEWLKNLIFSIGLEDKIAAVSSNMFSYDRPELIDSQGGSCDFIGEGTSINFRKEKDSVNIMRKEVLFPCFGAAIIKASLLEEIGYLDDRYFSYHEDLDWGWRANLLGYKVVFEDKAIVYHKGSATWKKYELKKIYLCKRNSLCTIIKNYELKNLLLALGLTLVRSITFFGGQLINKREDISFLGKLRIAFAPFYAFIWNFSNLRETLRLRKIIQCKRIVGDDNILDLQI
ncbi:MAG: glycosyltransferase family 2 protein [Candidatus Paceibacterota bacterium]|jgi:GT2 family glycosyltransferase